MRVKEQNNEEAFKQLCDTYRPYIYTIVKQFSLNHEDCEELTQDVLVKIWKALGSFLYEPERCKFRTWLTRVSKNAASNFVELKRNKSQRMQLDDSYEHILKLSTPSQQETNEEVEWKMFIANKAWDNIQNRFYENQLQCYKLVASGKSVEETAEALDLKTNTVYVNRKKVQAAMNIEIQRLSLELDG